jgi:AraC-like DNA-binding protein
MLNKSDCSLSEISNKVKKLSYPQDYNHGLPDSSLLLPDNILLFRGGIWLGNDGPNKSHSHHRFMMIIPTIGEGSLILDNCVYELTPGNMILIHPYQLIDYSSKYANEKTWLFISFDHKSPTTLEPLRNKMFIANHFQQNCCSNLLHEYLNKSSDGVSLLTATLLHTLINASGNKNNKQHIHADSFINKVIRYVNSHLEQGVQIQDIANEIGLSPSRLRTKFRDKLGSSLGKYVRQIRLQRAAIMIVSSNEPINRIAQQIGFETLFSFSRAFKSEYGVSPSSYRVKQNKSI